MGRGGDSVYVVICIFATFRCNSCNSCDSGIRMHPWKSDMKMTAQAYVTSSRSTEQRDNSANCSDYFISFDTTRCFYCRLMEANDSRWCKFCDFIMDPKLCIWEISNVAIGPINYLPANNYHVRLQLLLIVRFSLHFQTLRCVTLCTVAVYLLMK